MVGKIYQFIYSVVAVKLYGAGKLFATWQIATKLRSVIMFLVHIIIIIIRIIVILFAKKYRYISITHIIVAGQHCRVAYMECISQYSNTCCLALPCLAFGVGRLLHLPSAEAVSVRPNARPQK